MVDEPPRESLDDVKHEDLRELEEIPPEEPAALLGQALKDQVALKRTYGRNMLRMMAAQLFAVDSIFVAVAWAGYGWRVPVGLMQVWIGATFVEIVGIVTVVVRSIFAGEDVKAAVGLGVRVSDEDNDD